MNSLGLNLILRMGCLCSRESVIINGKWKVANGKYKVIEQIAQGFVISILIQHEHLLIIRNTLLFTVVSV